MTKRHLDFCTHVQNPEDVDILTRKNFDVNIRLFRINPEYRRIILSICDYIETCAYTSKEGYKKPHGWSGANGGIPFNIIAFRHPTAGTVVMMNPRIAQRYGEECVVLSNCGSLTLEERIKILRHQFIDVEFFDRSGKKGTWIKVPPTPGFTIQHEVDHTNGILIKEIKTRNEMPKL